MNPARAGFKVVPKRANPLTANTLADLGWSAAFQSQLTLEEVETLRPARIAEVQRDRTVVLTPDGANPAVFPGHVAASDVTVGDWVLLNAEANRIVRLLVRATEISRRAAGRHTRKQLIAANIDTLGIVTAATTEFSENRLERYLVLAASSQAQPLVILSKADTNDPAPYVDRVARVARTCPVIAIDARSLEGSNEVTAWVGKGRTLALVGSSGVGKTSLTNGLTGRSDGTQDVRDQDQKGRHTTTFRSLRPTRNGGWIIDTPGMREVGLVDNEAGLETVFADIEELSKGCRFRNCSHLSEPDCAVLSAVETGSLNVDRLTRWRQLVEEDARAGESIAEARSRDKRFGKVVREAMTEGKRKRDTGG